MRLRCTLTGVDEATDLDRLAALSARFPGAEWGVLHSPMAHAEGVRRFPSRDFALAVVDRLGGARTALHVCGKAVAELVAGGGEVEVLASRFGRVQLNLVARRHDPAALRALFARHRGIVFITQRNGANPRLAEDLAGEPNHAVLHDASGGRGESPEAWPAALPGVDCGYAGGLGPSNLAAEVARIAAASGGEARWVDAEGRLRDAGDRFDLDLAQAHLEAFSGWWRS